MSTPRDRFLAACPGGYFLDSSDLTGLTGWLAARGWIAPDDAARSAAPAGEGNMNCTLRVALRSGGTLIVKQSRPWVERYPQIDAPLDRALVEARFYALTGAIPALAARQPALLGVDPGSRILATEDLGAARDLTALYDGARLDARDLDALLDYLEALHGLRVPPEPLLRNRAMRTLNHEHIFDLPLRGLLDLDGYARGLADAAAPLLADEGWRAAIAALGRRYLADGDVLLHGDYYPGSWTRAGGALKVLDPEFCFLGPAAFDQGVLLAHLLLADQPRALIARALGAWEGSDRSLICGFAGAEIMRRLLGVAQLPLAADLARRRSLLERSRDLVLGLDPLVGR